MQGDKSSPWPRYLLCKYNRVTVFGSSSACALYRLTAVEMVGFLDELFVAYYEDVDLAFRLQLAGFKTIFVPKCRAYHVRAATQKRNERTVFLLERNRVLTLLKDLPLAVFANNFRRIVLATVAPLPSITGARRWTQLKGTGRHRISHAFDAGPESSDPTKLSCI